MYSYPRDVNNNGEKMNEGENNEGENSEGENSEGENSRENDEWECNTIGKNSLLLNKVTRYISERYDIVRMSIYHLILHQSYIERFLSEYGLFLEFVDKISASYPLNLLIRDKKQPVFFVNMYKRNNKRLQSPVRNIPNETLFIFGKKKLYTKIITIKFLYNRIFKFEKEIKSYLYYVEKSIQTLIDHLNTFHNIYTLHLQTLLAGNSQRIGDPKVYIRNRLDHILSKKSAMSYTFKRV